MISLMVGGSLEEAPGPKALRDSKLTITLNQSAHALSEKRIQFVDEGQRRARGGYGEVARAILHALENCAHPDADTAAKSTADTCKEVAVKILFISDDVSADTMERRFAREVYVWSQLRHENILQMLGHYFCNTRSAPGSFVRGCVVVMRWRICDPKGLISLKNFGWLQALLKDSITCILVFRPFVTVTSKQPMFSLMMAGHNSTVVEDGGSSSLATGSDFKGSIPWCSPELLNGGPRTPQSDIWAWGWFLWEIITGKRPFYDISLPAAIVYRIISSQLPDVSSLPEPSGTLMQICWKPHEKRSTLMNAITLLETAVSNGLGTQTQPAANFCAITPDIHISVNLPPSSPEKPALPTMMDSIDKPVAGSTTFIPGLPDRRQPPAGRSERNLGRIIRDFIGCCLCMPCRTHADAFAESLHDDSLDPVASSDKPGRQSSRSTSNARAPPTFEGPPSALDVERSTVAPGQAESRAVVLEFVEGDIRRTDTGNTISTPFGGASDPLSICDIVDIQPVNGAPSLFRGIRKGTGKMVAIKVPQDLKRAVKMICRGDAGDVRTEDDIVEAFREYINFGHSLADRHINSTDGHTIFEDSLGVVTPWCENGNIRNYMQHRPLETLWDLLDQVFQGLVFLHGQTPPIIHGSLKPENILIDADGRVVLSEVGELPFLEKAVVGITTCGPVDDIRWLPPEVLRGARWNTQSDVYTVGLLGQCLISGRLPFADVEAPAATARAISTGDRPFPNSGALFKDQPAWGLLNGCLVIEPTERPTIQALSFEALPEIPQPPVITFQQGGERTTALPTEPRDFVVEATTARKDLSASVPKTYESTEEPSNQNNRLAVVASSPVSGTVSSLHGRGSGEEISGIAKPTAGFQGEISNLGRQNEYQSRQNERYGLSRESVSGEFAGSMGGATSCLPVVTSTNLGALEDVDPSKLEQIRPDVRIKRESHEADEWPEAKERLDDSMRRASASSVVLTPLPPRAKRSSPAAPAGARGFRKRLLGDLSSSDDVSSSDAWSVTSAASPRTPGSSILNDVPSSDFLDVDIPSDGWTQGSGNHDHMREMDTNKVFVHSMKRNRDAAVPPRRPLSTAARKREHMLSFVEESDAEEMDV